MSAVSKDKRINYVEAAMLYVVYSQSLPQVAEHLGTTTPTVIRALKILGVPTRSIGDGKSIRCRGNLSKASKGYAYIAVDKNVRRLEHIHVVEQAIGRRLQRDEVVHHINGNRRDNRLENLQLMTRGEHTTLHHKKGEQRARQSIGDN